MTAIGPLDDRHSPSYFEIVRDGGSRPCRNIKVQGRELGEAARGRLYLRVWWGKIGSRLRRRKLMLVTVQRRGPGVAINTDAPPYGAWE